MRPTLLLILSAALLSACAGTHGSRASAWASADSQTTKCRAEFGDHPTGEKICAEISRNF